MSLRAILLAATLTVAAQAARQPGEPFRQGLNFFSKQQDIQLGREESQLVRKKFPLYRNDWVQHYVRGVGDRLAATGPARGSGFPFTFTVVENRQVNAFALPGGPMFIFTGLLQTVDNEAQLAAVMAHEMAHVILRHGTHEASKAEIIELPALLAGKALGNRSLLTRLTEMGAESFLLKFSRDSESEADALGAHLMAEAGYDPIEMSRFFGKLQAAGGQGNSRLAQFLSDHPNPGNRERLIAEEAQTIPRRQYGFETGGFPRMKADVGPAPRPAHK